MASIYEIIAIFNLQKAMYLAIKNSRMGLNMKRLMIVTKKDRLIVKKNLDKLESNGFVTSRKVGLNKIYNVKSKEVGFVRTERSNI